MKRLVFAVAVLALMACAKKEEADAGRRHHCHARRGPRRCADHTAKAAMTDTTKMGARRRSK